MNNNLQKIKYIILGVVLLFSGFIFTHQASALTYTYNCNDGGTISSVVTLNPAGPFSADAPSSFQANASMTSNSCGDRLVYLTGQNNSDPVANIISQTTLSLNEFINNQFIVLTSPNEGGDYNVNFTTWVDEPPLPNILVLNESLATTVLDTRIDGVSLPSPTGEFYVVTGNTMILSMDWSLPIPMPGSHIEVLDTNGNRIPECVLNQIGDPDPSYTWGTPIDMTGPNMVIITVADNDVCP